MHWIKSILLVFVVIIATSIILEIEARSTIFSPSSMTRGRLFQQEQRWKLMKQEQLELRLIKQQQAEKKRRLELKKQKEQLKLKKEKQQQPQPQLNIQHATKSKSKSPIISFSNKNPTNMNMITSITATKKPVNSIDPTDGKTEEFDENLKQISN